VSRRVEPRSKEGCRSTPRAAPGQSQPSQQSCSGLPATWNWVSPPNGAVILAWGPGRMGGAHANEALPAAPEPGSRLVLGRSLAPREVFDQESCLRCFGIMQKRFVAPPPPHACWGGYILAARHRPWTQGRRTQAPCLPKLQNASNPSSLARLF
jgi:hypothetical protein